MTEILPPSPETVVAREEFAMGCEALAIYLRQTTELEEKGDLRGALMTNTAAGIVFAEVKRRGEEYASKVVADSVVNLLTGG